MRTLVIIMLLLAGTRTFAQKEKNYHSHWHNEAEIKAMQPSDYIYTEKGKFYYFVSNDNENLYVNLKIFSPEVQNRVYRVGLITWVNMDGKKSKKTGIRFPVPSRPVNRGINQQGGGRASQGQNSFAGRSGEENRPLNRLDLLGFPESGEVEFTPADTKNFRGFVSMDNERYMNYELVIPLSKLPAISKGKGKTGNKPIMIGFTYPEASSPFPGSGGGGQGRSSGGPGGGGGGGGRGSGGGMRGGSMGGGSRGGGGYGGRGGMGSAPGSGSDVQVVFWINNIVLASEK